MKSKSLIATLVLIFAILACNLPSAVPGQQSPNEAAAPAGSVQTEAPAALDTPTLAVTLAPTLTPTPTIPIAWPSDKGVNCRLGPGTEWVTISSLLVGQTAEIVGKNDDASWWYIKDPGNPGSFCWVAASVTNTAGNLAFLPIMNPPQASVIKVTVKAEVAFVGCGGPNVVEFSGTITTNGPTDVSYQWEIRGDKSNTTSPETLKFKSADTKNAADPGAYKVDCGNYSITLHVLSPNDKSAKKGFSAP